MTLEIISAFLFLLGLILGIPLAKYTSKRTQKQPIGMDVEAEKKLLGAVLENPRFYPAVGELTSEAFVVLEHASLWADIQKEVVQHAKEDLVAKDEKELEVLQERMPLDLKEKLLPLHPVVKDLPIGELKLKDVLEEGGKVLAGHTDRTKLAGVAPIEKAGAEENYLVRRYVEPGKYRKTATTLLLALSFGVAPYLALKKTSFEDVWSAQTTLALVAILVLAVISIVVAFVDWDTLYLEIPTFWIGTGIAWLLASIAQVVDGNPQRLLYGVGIIVGLAIFFEVTTFLHSKIRKTMRQGFGDTQILVATAGVPAALAASTTLGLWAMLAGSILAVVGFCVLAYAKGLKKDMPFAFGPYLALGWVIAWLVIPLSYLVF